MFPIFLVILLAAFLFYFKIGKSKILFILSAYLMIQLIIVKLISLNDLIMMLNLLYQPIFLITAQSIICYILYSLGFFKWAAHTIVFTAEESEVKLLLHILLFSVLLAILTNVYTSIIISIFLIFDISENIKLTEYKIVKFIFLTSLFIDISSIMSPCSSLGNLIYMKFFNIGYSGFISKLFLPGFILVFVLYVFVFALNRKVLTRFTNKNIVDPDMFVKDWILLNLCVLAIFLIQISYFIVQNSSVPIYLMPLVLSLLLLIYMVKRGRFKLELPISKGYIFSIMAMSILVFTIYVLYDNLNYFNFFLNLNNSLTGIFIPSKIWLFFTSTLISSIFGDIAGAFINIKYLETIKDFGDINQILIYISIVGNIIGGKVFFYGSLCNVISKRMLTNKAFSFTFIKYLKIVFPLLFLCSIVFLFTSLWII